MTKKQNFIKNEDSLPLVQETETIALCHHDRDNREEP